MSDRPIFTYQTRPDLTPEQVVVLEAYADLYGKAERCLFAAIQAEGTVNDLKREFQPRSAFRPGSSTPCVSALKARSHRSRNVAPN